MIDVVENVDLNEIMKTVDMNRSLLIMGKAATNYGVNRIVYFDTTEAVRASYGDSDLTDAFILAKRVGAPHVFLVNVKQQHDYLDIANTLRHYDFAYIVSTDLQFGDAFFDATRNNKQVGYYHHFLEHLSSSTHSTFVATDNHASLYEDIDAYLDDMKRMLHSFKDSMSAGMNGSNLVFVLNNLSNYSLANVLLASTLCITKVGTYPVLNNLGPSVFDIDGLDVGEDELVYFRANHLSGATVENLVNFSPRLHPMKIVLVDRIVKDISRNLDLSRFKGKQMSPYQKIRVEKELVEFFEALINQTILSYDIKAIHFTKDVPGTGIITCEVDIWPVNTIEKFSIVLEG